MLTLAIFGVLLVVSIPVDAMALAVAARVVGSPRGTLRNGIWCMMLTTGIGAILFAATILRSQIAPSIDPGPASALHGLAQLCAVFLIVRHTFRLSVGRTFAPFMAHFAVSAILIFLMFSLLRPFVLEAFVLPTHSMEPTLNPGDRFVVSKILAPRRWDLVAYRTDAFEPGKTEIYCKRLVALPGERLRFENGTIYINDQAMDVPTVIAGRCHAMLPHMSVSSQRYKDGDTITLGARDYFFLGDNLDISGDSRLAGPSDQASIVGVIDLIFWPTSKMRVVR